MSHDLEFSVDGVAQAMFQKVAWHRLGTVVDRQFSWADAVAANLTITMPVEKVAMKDLVLGYTCRDDEFAALRTTDGVILKCGLGEQWTAFQAEQGYEFGQAIKTIAEEDESNTFTCDLISIGTLNLGRKWFMTFGLGEFAIGDYKIADYLSVNGSFDSTWPLQMLSSPIIEVCANTVAAATQMGMVHYRFKHTPGIFNRVEEAKKAWGKHHANREAFRLAGERLLGKKVTGEQYSKVLDALFPVADTELQKLSTKAVNANTEAREQVTTLWKASPFVSDADNAFSIVQAINTFENWAAPIRKTKNANESETRALRQIEALNSGVQPLTAKVWDLLMPQDDGSCLIDA